MRIVTLAIPDSHAGYQILAASAKRAGIVIEEISAGRKWEGFRTKMEAFHAAATGNDLMVIVDAFDVIVHPDAAEKLKAIETWFAANPATQILAGWESSCMSAENCLPLENWKRSKQTESRMHVNSGIICGRASAIKEWTSFMLDNGFHDDQLGLASFMNIKRAPYVELDVSRMLVHNVTGLHHLWPPEVSAAFAHFPGQSLIITPRWAYAQYAKKWAGIALRHNLLPIWIALCALSVLIVMFIVLPFNFMAGSSAVGLAWALTEYRTYM